ncbi:MAG TPA: hypothetical protein PK147_08995 [Saprospiraceae bacterium]|nr:hypothetical protein [Saprospiraceae bacterium]MCB9328607.1 hypothetical protein [Lewinellaceae bacterium]HPQ21975.1 hypothetical protein [Saprospiraceae bacterium]
MKVLLISVLMVFSSLLFSQKENYIIEVVKRGNDSFVRSCLDESLYIDDLVLPHKPNQEYVPGSKIERTHPISILDAFWEEECLLFPNLNYDEEYLKLMFERITLINRSSFIVKMHQND